MCNNAIVIISFSDDLLAVWKLADRLDVSLVVEYCNEYLRHWENSFDMEYCVNLFLMSEIRSVTNPTTNPLWEICLNFINDNFEEMQMHMMRLPYHFVKYAFHKCYFNGTDEDSVVRFASNYALQYCETSKCTSTTEDTAFEQKVNIFCGLLEQCCTLDVTNSCLLDMLGIWKANIKVKNLITSIIEIKHNKRNQYLIHKWTFPRTVFWTNNDDKPDYAFKFSIKCDSFRYPDSVISFSVS